MFASTFSGCGDDDDDWMPPTANGKADGALVILKGSDVPSQYVDAGKHYLPSRRIDTLEQIAALKDVPASVAHRADGIIANLPMNGRLDAAELVKMEKPQFFVTLYPEEQQALPLLWKLLEAPAPNPTAVDVPVVDLTITPQLVEPGGLTYPTSIAIATLPADLQPAAKRVQLAFNADSNAATIQVVDIDKVLADPGAFTPTEVAHLQAVKLVFAERATSTEEAKAKVPTPGRHTKTTTFGQMSLELAANVTIRESRISKLQYNYNAPADWTVGLAVEQESSMTLHAPADSKLVVLELDTGNETVFADSDVAYVQHPVGNVVIERYTLGERKETHEVALPPFEGTVSKPADDFIDYRLFAGTTELHKNVYQTGITDSYNRAAYAYSRYETTANEPTDTDRTIVDLLATPKSSLPPSRYEIAGSPSNIAIDIYPQRVVIAHYAGHTARLLPYWTNDRVFYGEPGIGVTFNPNTNALASPVADATLTAAQRTK